MRRMNILDDIPLDLEGRDVLASLKTSGKGPDLTPIVEEILESVRKVARPKVLFKEVFLGARTEDTVEIEGIVFTSRVLAKNLKGAERVFPYVATAGRELEGIDIPKDDLMKNFLLDAIKELVLEGAICYFDAQLKKRYALGLVSHMSPGSLTDWSIDEQKNLFALLGGVESKIGVRLKPSYMMEPIKSVSGIIFPTEISFESCMLCTRPSCPKRRAAYDPKMAREYGA
jgi:hypothetical protein